jgi:hypothetical protein
MEFIKRNYEKIILSLVLLGLVGVLAFMPFVIFYDRQQMDDLRTKYIPRKPEALPGLDMSRQDKVLERLKTPLDLDFSMTNKLFNPVQWQKGPDGKLIKIVKGTEIGPGAIVVLKITPLYYAITLVTVDTNGLAPRYSVSIEDQTAVVPSQRRKRPHYVSKGESVVDKMVAGKNEGFTLTDIKGPPENPDALVVKLADTGETATLSKSQPFRRVDGYTADLKYDPEPKNTSVNAAGLRVNADLKFADDEYNIIAIDKNDVILLAQSNQKKFTLRYAP